MASAVFDSGNAARRRKTERGDSIELAEIGEIPAVVNPERRERCRLNLLSFLTEYFPMTTGLSEFSEPHKSAIQRLQNGMLHGNARVLNAFPRGFGKTTLAENSAIWALLYGHRKFIPIIAADESAAKENLTSIKTELETNEMLYEDFPEVCRPVESLEGKPQRCASQTHDGERTYIKWMADTLVFPTVKINGVESAASGGVVVSRGITGRIRGMKHKRPDGTQQRPDFVIVDDFETDESAQSPAQCDKRLGIISNAILRLTGHKSTLSVVINGTCICEGSATDILLDRKKHPEWESVRIPMMKSMASAHDDLWLDQYATIRKTYNPEDPHDRRRAIADANRFYLEHRSEMDAGAEATWATCFADGEHSAIQHAYNILIDDGESVFASECQNQPVRFTGSGGEFLTSNEMQRTRIGIEQMPPAWIESVGFHIDVQHRCLYFTVLGAGPGFSLCPIEYGQFPAQPRGLIPYAEVTRETLEERYPGVGKERAIELGVAELIDLLFGKIWTKENGVDISVDQGLIDANDQTDAVRRGIKRSKHSTKMAAAFGRSVKAADTPMLQLKLVEGEKRSTDTAIPWRHTPDRKVIGQRLLFVDVNAVKTFLHRRIAAPLGDTGSFEMLNGDHRAYCDHVCDSEYPTKTTGPWGEQYEWKARPQRPDNHLLDTTVGAIVAISLAGKVQFEKPIQRVARKRKKVSPLF